MSFTSQTKCCPWLRRLVSAALAGVILIACSSASWAQPAASPNDQIRLKLRYLSNALHSRQDVLKSMAPARIADGPARGSQLSWRVHLLPFIGEPELYEEFHFDEPWDSQHNQSLLPRMPAVYGDGDKGQKTRFQAYMGEKLLFGNNQPTTSRSVRDGLPSTILLVVTAADKAVTWTQPDDLSLDPQKPAEVLGKVTTIECLMADGRLVSLPSTIPAADFAAMITPAGGETVDVEKYRVEVPSTLTPQMQVRAARYKDRREIMQRMQAVGRAMQSYHDLHRMYPVVNQPQFHDDQGRPKLSWRVHILPYLDQKALFDQFKLDEPWDSPHNKPLVDKMPTAFADPADKPNATKTRLMVVRGGGALFSAKIPPNRRSITDGTSYTAMLIRVGTDKAVPWTKPDDADFDPQRPKSVLGTIDDLVYIVTAGGAVKVLKAAIPDELFRSLMTCAGGEVINEEELEYMAAP